MVIDPGPVDQGHAEAIGVTIGARSVSAVMVTHTHPDHAPLANQIGAEFEAPVYGYRAGPDFFPDQLVADGDQLSVGSESLRVIHTPGHADDHLCFLTGRLLFTGDHIMGGSSVMVEDLTAYLASLRRLQSLALDRLYPGHGPEMEQPDRVIDWYLAHRQQREEEILAALEAGPARVDEIVERVYAEVDSVLYPLAAQNVNAHLEKLKQEGRVTFEGDRAEVLL
jgi:glyoxylase-like metal-dependent hydrolase (beta-lactamase superfamily II)